MDAPKILERGLQMLELFYTLPVTTLMMCLMPSKTPATTSMLLN